MSIRKRVLVSLSEAGDGAPDSSGIVEATDGRPAGHHDGFVGRNRLNGDGDGFPPGRGLRDRPTRDGEASSTIRVLIADDHPVYRDGLAALIGRQPGMTVVAEAADGREAVEAYASRAPDVALIDLRMPGLDGIEAVAAIRGRDPMARAVIISAFAVDEDIYRALRVGARGYLIKDAGRDELIDCIRAVHAGRTFIPPEIAIKLAEHVTTVALTARERQVLSLVAKGRGNRDIGNELTVTEGTVKVHVNNILSKLGVGSRTEAVTLGLRRGLVRLED